VNLWYVVMPVLLKRKLGDERTGIRHW